MANEREMSGMSAPTEKVDVRSEIANFWTQRVIYLREKCKASARKSLGSYKPVIVSPGYPSDVTEVVGTRSEARYRTWIGGRPDPKTVYMHYERGKTFSTRGEAVEYAAAIIARRVADAEAKADAALARIGGA